MGKWFTLHFTIHTQPRPPTAFGSVDSVTQLRRNEQWRSGVDDKYLSQKKHWAWGVGGLKMSETSFK